MGGENPNAGKEPISRQTWFMSIKARMDFHMYNKKGIKISYKRLLLAILPFFGFY